VKRNILIGGIAAIIVLAIVALLGWQSSKASAAATTRPQTVTVQRGTIAATVNAAGNVSAPDQASIAFQSSGRVAQAPVLVGDLVKKGQLLMQLDTTDLNISLEVAQANLAGAKANYDASVASLKFAIKTAQANIMSAQASLDDANAKAKTQRDQLLVAKAAVDKTSVALQTAQGNNNAVSWRGPNDAAASAAAAALQSAQDDYNSAVASYQIAVAQVNDTAVRAAQATLDSAQTALAQAQSNQDTSTRSAQAAVDSAQVAVDQAQRNLDAASLYAPFDGVVAAVNYNVGDSAGSTTAVALADLSNLQVKATIAEIDMAKLKTGDTVQVTFDAIANKTYQGTVLAIGPAGTITSGVVNYPVTVVISKPDAAVKPGMTANLTIAVDQKTGVLVVPARAVRTQGNQKVVTVLSNGQTKTVTVKTGLSDDTSIEITSGLQAGDVVVLNQTVTRVPTGGVGLPGLGGRPGGD
jgi:HlyD family secretion protein